MKVAMAVFAAALLPPVGITAFADDAYIQTSGAQIIDTGYYPNPQTKVVVDWSYVDTSTKQQRIFGVQTDNDSYLTFASYINGNGQYAWAAKDGAGNWTSTGVGVNKDRCQLTMDLPGQHIMLVKAGVTKYNLTSGLPTATKTSAAPLALFGIPSGSGYAYYGSVKFYSMQIWEGARLVHYFLPYKSGETVGVKDIVDGSVHVSATATAITQSGGDIDDNPSGDAAMLAAAGYRFNETAGKIEAGLSVDFDQDCGGMEADGVAVSSGWAVWCAIGGTVTLTPVPAAGYKFYAWEGDIDGVVVSAAGVATVPIPRPRTLRCVFTDASRAGVRRVWTGGAGRDWGEADNWQPTGAPSTGDDVVIAAGNSAVIAAESAALNSFTLGGTLTFTNWLTKLSASTVVISNGATVTCAGPYNDTTDMSNRVWIAAADSFTLASGGKINVTERGYGSVTNVSGTGLGPGKCGWGSGAAYGGCTAARDPYGNAAAPLDPGTSGGTRTASYRKWPGGGAVFLDCPAARVEINGSITADGHNGGEWAYGPSTGGSIYIRAKNFVSAGATITAIGGNRAGRANAASGGRISIVYDTAVQSADDVDSSTRISAAGGKGGNNWAIPNGQAYSNGYTDTDDNGRWARPGTVYFPDDRLLGKVLSNPTGFSGEIVLGSGKDAVISNGFTMSNGYIVFGNELTNVVVKGDVALNGVNAYLSVGASRKYPGFVRTFNFVSDAAVAPRLEICGDLTMTLGSRLDLLGVMTPGWNEGVPGGVLDVKGDIVMSGQAQDTARGLPALTSVVYCASCATNGTGYHIFASNVNIGVEGRFDGREHGYQQWKSKSDSSSRGPGRGSQTIGAGHGGAGYGANATYGKTYGEEMRPCTPGSSGAPKTEMANRSGSYNQSPGGGAFRITAYNALDVYGQIRVDALRVYGDGGGGSGGSLWLEGKTFHAAAGALISAAGATAYNAAAGGGGRIALWIGAPGCDYSEIAAYSETTVGEIDASGAVFDVSGGKTVSGGEGCASAGDGTLKIYNAVPKGQNLEVVSEPLDAFGECDPGWGSHVVSAGRHVFTATDVTNQSERVRCRCTGWRMEKLDVSTGEYGIYSFGNTPTCDFTMDDGVYRLSWIWTKEVELTATPDAGGAVQFSPPPKDAGWYTLGDSVTLTPAAEAGYVFTMWSGDVDAANSLDNPLVVAADAAKTLNCGFQATVPGGQLFTWTGESGSGKWYDTGNWRNSGDQHGLPSVDDTVAIPADSGTILLDRPSAQLSAFSIASGSTLVFTNWTTALRAGTVTLGSNSTVTCAGPFSDRYTPVYKNIDMSNRVWFVCNDFTLSTAAVIDVNYKGYGEPAGISSSAERSYGPGGTPSYYCGGTHGGVGGKGVSGVVMRREYDSVSAPFLAGSSGGVGGWNAGRASAGGGVVRVEATGTVTLDGTITANGVSGDNFRASGGGAGGSVYISARRFVAEGGVVSASGGVSRNDAQCGGGGGRIALRYDTAAQDMADIVSLALDVAPGAPASAPLKYRDTQARPGTIWCPDDRLFVKFAGTDALKGVLVPGDAGELTFAGLTVSNTYLSIGSQVTNLHIAGDLRIAGGNTRFWFGAGDLLYNSTEMLRFTSERRQFTLTVDGDLTVTGGAAADFHPAPTNGTDGAQGGFVNVGGDFTVEGLGSVTSVVRVGAHPLVGSTIHFTAGNINVRRSGWMTADALGWGVGVGMWGGARGPGKGSTSNTDLTVAVGAGHGGKGVRGTGSVGAVYDSETRPAMAGSSGKSEWSWSNDGGGYLHLRSRGDFTLGGRISADAWQGTYNRSSAPSGGGVLLEARRFSADSNAVVTARGGSHADNNGAAGGGGRIAVWTGEAWNPKMRGNAIRELAVADVFADPRGVSAAGGTTPNGQTYGEDGTVKIYEANVPGFLLLLR